MLNRIKSLLAKRDVHAVEDPDTSPVSPPRRPPIKATLYEIEGSEATLLKPCAYVGFEAGCLALSDTSCLEEMDGTNENDSSTKFYFGRILSVRQHRPNSIQFVYKRDTGSGAVERGLHFADPTSAISIRHEMLRNISETCTDLLAECQALVKKCEGDSMPVKCSLQVRQRAHDMLSILKIEGHNYDMYFELTRDLNLEVEKVDVPEITIWGPYAQESESFTRVWWTLKLTGPMSKCQEVLMVINWCYGYEEKLLLMQAQPLEQTSFGPPLLPSTRVQSQEEDPNSSEQRSSEHRKGSDVDVVKGAGAAVDLRKQSVVTQSQAESPLRGSSSLGSPLPTSPTYSKSEQVQAQALDTPDVTADVEEYEGVVGLKSAPSQQPETTLPLPSVGTAEPPKTSAAPTLPAVSPGAVGSKPPLTTLKPPVVSVVTTKKAPKDTTPSNRVKPSRRHIVWDSDDEEEVASEPGSDLDEVSSGFHSMPDESEHRKPGTQQTSRDMCSNRAAELGISQPPRRMSVRTHFNKVLDEDYDQYFERQPLRGTAREQPAREQPPPRNVRGGPKSKPRKERLFDDKKHQFMEVGSHLSLVGRSKVGNAAGGPDGFSLHVINNLTDKDQVIKGNKFEYKNKTVTPAAGLLHNQDDRKLLFVDRRNQGQVFQMDVEREKVVSAHSTSGAPAEYLWNSNAQNNSSTFMAGGGHVFYMMDTRATDNSAVSKYKDYRSIVDLTCGASTDTGQFGIASASGVIRLYDGRDNSGTFGIAKTQLPSVGRGAIKHIDVLPDGKWIIATTKTCLILHNTVVAPGTTAFAVRGASRVAEPIILQLKGADIRKYKVEDVDFRPAVFNKEADCILTSVGNLAIAWDFAAIKCGESADRYTIKRMANVINDCKPRIDGKVMVALSTGVEILNQPKRMDIKSDED